MADADPPLGGDFQGLTLGRRADPDGQLGVVEVHAPHESQFHTSNTVSCNFSLHMSADIREVFPVIRHTDVLRKRPMKPKLSAAKPSRKTKAKGRPVRRDNPQRITLYLALATKRKAYDIAVARRCSISRLVEELLDGCRL